MFLSKVSERSDEESNGAIETWLFDKFYRKRKLFTKFNRDLIFPRKSLTELVLTVQYFMDEFFSLVWILGP